jgi:hypothetical protein
MRNLYMLFVHVLATIARILGSGGIRSVVAESVLIKHQLLIFVSLIIIGLLLPKSLCSSVV